MVRLAEAGEGGGHDAGARSLGASPVSAVSCCRDEDGWSWLLVLVRAALHSETEAECDCLLRCAQLLTTEEAAVVALPLELL